MITSILRRRTIPVKCYSQFLATGNPVRRHLTCSTAFRLSNLAYQPSTEQSYSVDSGYPFGSDEFSSRSGQDGEVYIESRLRLSPYPSIPKDQSGSPSVPVWDGKDLCFQDVLSGRKEVVSKRWLRDQCPCEKCVHPETRQRQINTFQIKPDIAIKNISIAAGEKSAKIEWDDGHESSYPVSLLHKSKPRVFDLLKRGVTKRSLFDSSIAKAPPTVEYESVMSGDGVAEWTRQINTHGFSFVKGCPIDGLATKQLLEKIGPIRETHYGGFYDFTSNMASKDTAYTTLSLGAHTDTTYFSEPAGLQMFHMLSHTDGSGGESLLVDGFAAATKLYHDDREAYQILSTVRVWSHASGNEDVSIQPYTCFPVLSHDPVMGHLVMVRWNSDDRAGIEAEGEMVDKWYEAAEKFYRILNHPDMQYWTQLQPGVPLIFDNWRVLHGRSQFVGKRRMCGGYINRDDYVSKFKMSNMGRERVLESTVTG